MKDKGKKTRALTTEDVWKMAGEKPIKVAIMSNRFDDENKVVVPYPRYFAYVRDGILYACNRGTLKEWCVRAGEDPCEKCSIKNKAECDKKSLKVIDDDILLLEKSLPMGLDDLLD